MEIHTTTADRPHERLSVVPGVSATDIQLGEPISTDFLGFGGCFNELGWKALCKAGTEDREAVMQALFATEGDCNFRYCRLPMGANDFAESWYSYAEVEGDFGLEHFTIERDRRHVLPFLRAAATARGDRLQLFASPWSPPTWLKHPAVYNFGHLVDDPRHQRTYADYFVRYLRAYESEGFAIDAVHVQNEPNSDQKFPSCVWSGPQMRDFIRDYLGPALSDAGLPTEIWIGTIERGDHNAWVGTIMADEAAAVHVKGAGFQWAGKAAVQQARQAYPDLPIIQTESECGDGENSWSQAHYVFDLIRHYLVNGARAYVYWNMALETGGMSSWGWKQNSLVTVDSSTGAVTYNPEFHVMRHFGRVVRPGATVLATAGRWSANLISVRNHDSQIGHVIRNPHGSPQEVTVPMQESSVKIELPPYSFTSLQG